MSVNWERLTEIREQRKKLSQEMKHVMSGYKNLKGKDEKAKAKDKILNLKKQRKDLSDELKKTYEEGIKAKKEKKQKTPKKVKTGSVEEINKDIDKNLQVGDGDIEKLVNEVVQKEHD